MMIIIINGKQDERNNRTRCKEQPAIIVKVALGLPIAFLLHLNFSFKASLTKFMFFAYTLPYSIQSSIDSDFN